MNCFNSIAGKFIKIIAMNPFIFYDISHKPQLRPPRLFTDVFEEEMEKRLREGMDPVLAVEEARSEEVSRESARHQEGHSYKSQGKIVMPDAIFLVLNILHCRVLAI